MKFKPNKVQDLISTMALELHKNIAPINRDKFCKITASLMYFLCQNYTLDVFHLSFFCTWKFDVLLFSTFLIHFQEIKSRISEISSKHRN